jgi:flagellar hook-associated protein 3 FlgL
MLRGPDAQTSKFLADLARINRRLDTAQFQITSGRRINHVSDAPDDIARLLEMRSELSSTEQVRTNLSRTQSEVDAAEQAIRHATDLMDRVLSLGTQGASDISTPAQRVALSLEIGAILEQLVNAAATSNEGRFLFSGDADQTPPYSIDINLDAPLSFYNGAASTRQIMHPAGTLFSVARTAEEIFDNVNPAANVFQSVNALRLALRDNNPTAIRDALSNVRTAATHVTNMLAYYGTVQNQVAEAVDFGYKQELRLKTQISTVQDADMTAAILDLNRARFQQETSLKAQAGLRKTSLFDYLG